MNTTIKSRTRFAAGATLLSSVFLTSLSQAALVTDPNDGRNWQGATIGTFAALYYGSDTPANRQLVVDNQLLDDGLFGFANATAATLTPGSTVSGSGGFSHDLTGTGSFDYTISGDQFTNANSIDNRWIQTSGTIGATVFDLGAPSTGAAIFNTIDHGPLPQEAIESTVYLSNDQTTWTQAKVERVWLEGFSPILGIKWDGFVYAVGTGTDSTFRYASITHGGPGALINDGDDEINGVLGLNRDLTPSGGVPDGGSTLALLSLALGGVAAARRKLGIRRP